MGWYGVLKTVHVACVIVSIAGFVARYLLAVRGSPLLRRRLVRVLPHVNDTLLLAAAVGMLIVARWNVLEQAWLMAKITGLLAYIVFGTFALRRARTAAGRRAAFAAALLSFAFVVAVALSKNPLGPLAWWT